MALLVQNGFDALFCGLVACWKRHCRFDFHSMKARENMMDRKRACHGGYVTVVLRWLSFGSSFQKRLLKGVPFLHLERPVPDGRDLAPTASETFGLGMKTAWPHREKIPGTPFLQNGAYSHLNRKGKRTLRQRIAGAN